jgi:cytidylate kinase
MAILSISREYKSGGGAIGRAVSEQMGYDFVDKHRIHEDLKKAGARWEHLDDELDEVRPSLWERYDWEYQGYIALVESSIFAYALKDRVVILGRGSNFLLADIPQVLKVRLKASLEVRLERLMQKDDMDRETAAWLIKKTDRTRAGYVQANYGKHWDDKSYYDLVLDTGLQTYEQVTDRLVQALKKKDEEAAPEGRQRLENKALAARIKARIFTHPGLFLPALEIFHDGEAVVLRGVVHRPGEYHLVEDLARQMAGPCPVRNALHYRK